MGITFQCSHCAETMEADEGMGGLYAKCPSCHAQLMVPVPPLASGTMIGGFRVERKLGSGAMGEVYLAIQLSMEREVALKVLPPAMTADREDLERFMREVRTLGRLNHPNIVTAFEAGDAGGYHYLAMYYVDGDTLESRLEKRGRLSEKEALSITRATADALAYAWGRFQILHRDVKPANIMIDRQGNVRLMDMGISKPATEDTGLTMAGFIVGTPQYMSPEQARGEEDIDFRADMYSLGATLYHLVTGRPPFEGDSTLNVLSRLLSESYTPVRQLNPEVSAGLEQIISRTMMKERAARYGSWQELIQDLDRLQKGRVPKAAVRSVAAAAAAATATAQTKERGSRLPLIAVAGGVLIVGSGIFLWNVSQKPVRPTAPAAAPTVAVPPTAGPGAEPAKPDRSAQLEEMLRAARAYAEENPEDYDGAIRKFELVTADAAGTRFRLEAEDEMRNFQNAREKATGRVAQELREKADVLVSEGRFDEAAAAYREYVGPLAARLAARREAGIKDVEAKRNESQARKEALAKAGKGKSEILMRELAGRLAEQGVPAAWQRFQESRNDDALAAAVDMTQLEKELKELLGMSDAIRDAFQADIGKTVTVQLKTGKEALQIAGVGGSGVRARKLIKVGSHTGSVSRDFTVEELSLQEKFVRLGTAQKPHLDMMRGLLLLQAQRKDQAKTCFERAGSSMGKAMVDHLSEKAPPEKPDVETAADAAREAEVAALKEILREAALPPAEKDSKVLVTALRSRPYTREAAEKIRGMLSAFRTKYGSGETAREYAELLGALGNIIPFSKVQLEKALAQLVKDNPPLKNGFRHSEKTGEGQLTVMLENNPGLTDISALRGLPMTVLALNNTKVRDISPLKGMPLDDLGLWNTKVDDIRTLEGMPLTILSLNSTAIDDIKILKGMRLTWLDLSFTGISDIGTVRGMPLQTIKLEECKGLRDLSPLGDCRDLSAIILPPNPKDISFLKRLPNLRFIGTNWKEAEMPAEQFWKKYGARFR